MRKRSLDEAGSKAGPKRVSVRVLILTSMLSVFLGILLSVGALYLRLGENGLSVLQAMSVIRDRFVGEYEWNNVVDETMDGMVTSLNDRWSYYLTGEEYLRLQEARENAYTGIGITISKEVGNSIQVLAVAKASPAEEWGVKAGDAILSVNGVEVTEKNWENCVELIRGEEGTTVTLVIQSSSEVSRTIEVMRKEIFSIPVEYEMLPGKIGLVRMMNFYSGSADAFIEGVDSLVQDGAQSIIFDVRDNPGGYVTELTKMLDHLLPEGTIFVSCNIEGKETTYTSDAASIDLPFAVIVNGESYSAAEFFAAQLQESVGAVIVGEKTSGKGYAQQLFPLQNGSAIGLSTSKYYTAAGVSLIGIGLTPDSPVILSEEERLLQLQGEMTHDNDPQLKAAMAAVSRSD
jgi:carboxyl-terminal processing protease